MRKVEVIWHDACTRGGWSSREDYLTSETALVHSVGYLLYRDKKKIILVQSWDTTPGEPHVSDSVTIPAQWVKKVCFLS